MRLVIVESPAKAKTINKYLGSDYKVIASYGHVRDLPAKQGSVNPDDNFHMSWELSDRGSKFISTVKKEIQTMDELLLATDPDREGEAISWHIAQILKEQSKKEIPYKRIVFHEITKNAIKEAILHPRDIDKFLVDAYLTRRALDYLVGFTLSPILWRKLPGSKSAGRVQSVALRLVVDRETEIEAFEKKEYWTIDATFNNAKHKKFKAHLTHYNGEKLEKFSINNKNDAFKVKEDLEKQNFKISSIEKKQIKRNPPPPFITSTLQQEASRKLGFSAKKTMQLAQKLYEGIEIGHDTIALITYMRTDSLHLSKEAVDNIRKIIPTLYGESFLPESPRIYTTKVKNAQEAHEAIRPVYPDMTPENLKGKMPEDLLKLYSLIWKRTFASQMKSAEFDQVQVDIQDDKKDIFRATGTTLTFEGFLKLYVEGKDEETDEENNDKLPPLEKNESLKLALIEALEHFTTPPPRFSEASLVKKLEELGIGRPSTYASILQVLRDRGYVKLVKKYFVPEIRGRLVTTFLMNFFSKYLEYGFTADLEQSLDDVSNGKKEKLSILDNFWQNFKQHVDSTQSIKVSNVIDKLNEELETFLFSDNNTHQIIKICPECKQGSLSLKIGKFGAFVGCSRFPECGYIKKLDSSTENEEKEMSTEYPKFIGNDPKTNQEIHLKSGPYGFYLEKSLLTTGKKKTKPERASLPKFIPLENVNLDIAMKLLSLPKIIGKYEQEDVSIGIGRYGPYLFFKSQYISIPNPSEEILSMNLDQAINIIKTKQTSSAASSKATKKKEQG